MARVSRQRIVETDELSMRDRPYESFGQQGVALPTWCPNCNAESATDEDVDPTSGPRGAERVDLGERLARPLPQGPKGWQRRDDRIHDDVCIRLTDDAYVDATDVEVVVHQGEVVLSGSVMDRAQRVRAVALATSVRGVVDVVDRLRVNAGGRSNSNE